MMRLLAVATTAVLIALLSTATGPADAKCTDPAIDVRWPQPDADHTYLEAGWGDTVQLVGYCWVAWSGEELVWKGEQFEVFARFSLAMPDGEGTALPPTPSLNITGDAGFNEPFTLDDVFGRPDESQPGWVEFVARSDDVEARRVS